MNDWGDLINTINYVGAKIEAAPYPAWVKWPLFFLLLFFALLYVIRAFWYVARSVEKNMEKDQGIEDYARAYEIFDERIKNESDPEKKAILINKRDEALGKLKPK